MNRNLLILIFAFIIGATAMHTAQAQTYDPHAVEVINNLIANNGLEATPDAPETWEFAAWNDETPKQLSDLIIYGNSVNLIGSASFADLTSLFQVVCSSNNLTEIDATNCTSLFLLYCQENNLTKVVLPMMDDVLYFKGSDQKVSLTLYKNETGTYSFSIDLNTPVFENPAIHYENGVLESTDNTVTSTSFKVQTGREYCELDGIIYFSYNDVGIDMLETAQLKIYPNPSNDTLFIECEDFLSLTIKIYNMQGKEILSQNVEGKTEINISHLPDGVYIVNAISKDKIIESIKIVKQ